MKHYFIIFVAFLMGLVASCEKPQEPEPVNPDGDQRELEVNEYAVGKEIQTFASVAVSNHGEYICIAATPAEGIGSFDAVFEQEEYFYVAISPLLNGKSFDLMTEDALYTVMSTLEGVELETVAPSMTEAILSGTCTFAYSEGVVSVEISLILQDGSTFAAKLSAAGQGLVVNDNIFAINGDEKPVRAAFYLVEDNLTTLFLTPAGIEYFDELPITTYYAYITLDSSLCHGGVLDVNEVSAVGYADNFNELIVDSGETKTTGEVCVYCDPDDPVHYAVSADLDFSGTTLKIRFDGSAIDANVKEVIRNEIIYGDNAYAVTEVLLDRKSSSESLYKVILHTETGKILNIVLPSDFLDGTAHGFSQSPDLYILFDGNEYSYAEGFSGTVTVGIDGEMMKIEATNYDGLKITYEGSYSEVD